MSIEQHKHGRLDTRSRLFPLHLFGTLVSDRPLFLLVGIIAPLIIATVGANLL